MKVDRLIDMSNFNTIPKNLKFSCKNCDVRKSSCHDNCEQYKKHLDELHSINEKEREYKRINWLTFKHNNYKTNYRKTGM